MGLMCLFPPCFILIQFVSLFSVPFPTYEFISTEITHITVTLLTLSLFPLTKNTTRCLSLLYLIHLSCVAGWDEVTVPFSDSVLKEESGGLLRPSFSWPKYHLSKKKKKKLFCRREQRISVIYSSTLKWWVNQYYRIFLIVNKSYEKPAWSTNWTYSTIKAHLRPPLLSKNNLIHTNISIVNYLESMQYKLSCSLAQMCINLYLKADRKKQ